MTAELVRMPGTEDKSRSYGGTERRRQPEVHLTAAEMREIVASGTKDAIQQVFTQLGIDLTDPEDLINWYANMKFLDDMRKTREHEQKAGIAGNVALRNGLFTGLFSALLAFLIAKFTK